MKQIPWEVILPVLKGVADSQQRAAFETWSIEESNMEIFNDLKRLWEEIIRETSQYDPDMEGCWNELQKRMGMSGEGNGRVVRRFGIVQYAVAAAVALLVGIAGFMAARISATSTPEAPLSYSSVSGKSKVILADGTTVWLHGNSAVSCEPKFGRKTRTVNVTGEAFFEVEKNENKPFVVKSGGISATVYGTKFNFRSRPEEDRITVSLVEGSLGVESSDMSVMLQPGEEARYYKSSGTLRKLESDNKLISTWANQSIRFVQRPLDYIVESLRVWYDTEIILENFNPDTAYAYTFTITDEPLEEIVRLISRLTPIDYSFDINKLTIKIK